ncbi:HAMP domain-containing sensor histidine kinase [Paenibacillus sp. HB172176]|uniref:sensor histidine kinase n=1 Tax=Paenibacillus sp. HB172176 TaxID=2493690 RepID=UPI001439143E|nr:HAMP domain-containing sensor histidine kinase [Paenibacillus sp. HB172176]
MKASLYIRVLIIILYTIAISGMLGYYAATLYYHWHLKSHNDAKLFLAAETIQMHIEKFPNVMGDYLGSLAYLGYQVYVYDEAGNEMFYGRDFGKNDLSSIVKERVLRGETYHGIAEFPNHPFSTGYFDNLTSNTVGVQVQASAERYALFLRHDSSIYFDELRIFFQLMFVLSLLFCIPYFLFSVRYIVQPIVRLMEAAKRVAQGQYSLQLPTKRKDEIGQLAVQFQKMGAALERTDRAKKEFVANVSHEIQSPLTSIQGYADSLLQEELPWKERMRYAAIIGQETRHLAALSRQLLLLSTLEHDGRLSGKRSIPVRQQLRQALQTLEWQLAEKDIAVRIIVQDQLTVAGDEVLLMQVWSNLLSNAVKHIPSGRSIIIEGMQEEDCSVISIRDTGEGIPEEQLPYIYDRFYRGDAARERRTGSTGLGLSIVKRIVHMHEGSIHVVSKQGKGTSFTVRIPSGHSSNGKEI